MSHGFLPFSPLSLTELCSFLYGLKDLFTLHTLSLVFICWKNPGRSGILLFAYPRFCWYIRKLPEEELIFREFDNRLKLLVIMEFWCIDVVGRKLMLVTLKTWKAKDIIYYYFIIFGVTCEQALQIGREQASERWSRERPRKGALLSLPRPRVRVSSRAPLTLLLFTISPKWKVCLQAIYSAPFVYK